MENSVLLLIIYYGPSGLSQLQLDSPQGHALLTFNPRWRSFLSCTFFSSWSFSPSKTGKALNPTGVSLTQVLAVAIFIHQPERTWGQGHRGYVQTPGLGTRHPRSKRQNLSRIMYVCVCLR